MPLALAKRIQAEEQKRKLEAQQGEEAKKKESAEAGSGDKYFEE